MKSATGSASSPEGLHYDRQAAGVVQPFRGSILSQAAGVVQPFRAAILALGLFLLSPAHALACSCVGDVPLCQSFWQADAVFSGDVVSFEELNTNRLFQRRVARIRVERAWRGQVQGTVEVRTGAGGGDCGYSFRPGRKYLVYAYKTQDGKLTTGICSPTKLLDKAAADLAYFEEAEKPSTGGRIYGTARLETKGVDLKPAPGAAITLAGESQPSRTAVTNEAGDFEFTGVPAGTYLVSMQGATTPPWKVELRDPRACVHVNLWAPR
jgi:hypothetical protein